MKEIYISTARINHQHFLEKAAEQFANNMQQALSPYRHAFESMNRDFKPSFVIRKDRRIEHIEKVIYNPPATVVIFNDGYKSIAKCRPGDEYNKKAGFAIAFAKAQFTSNGGFNRFLEKWEV